MPQALCENIFCHLNVQFHEEPFLKTMYNSVVPRSLLSLRTFLIPNAILFWGTAAVRRLAIKKCKVL